MEKDKRKSRAIANAVTEDQANGKTNQEKLTLLETFVVQPSRSDLERKRSTTGNIAVQNKRPRGSTKAKKKILVHLTPAERLTEKEFKNEPYKITAGVKAYVFCLACREEVSIKKDRILDHTRSAKHEKNKTRYQKTLESGKVTLDVIASMDAGTLPGPSGDIVIAPSALSDRFGDVDRVFRMDLVKNWMKCGFPFNSIEKFKDFLHKYTRHFPDQSHLKHIIPVIQAAELQDIKQAAGSKPFSISFDGTTRVCEAFAIVVRFLDEQFNPIQKLLTISFIDDQLNGLTTATEVVRIIFNRFGIEDSLRVAGFMRDGAQVNAVAIRQLQVFFENAEDLQCLAHTLDLVGTYFKHPTLTRFWGHWLQMMTHSRRAHKIYKNVMGFTWKSYSPTRWWSKYECFNALCTSFGDLLTIITQIKDASISEAPSAEAAFGMLTDIRTVSELKVELAAVQDGATLFIKATYTLEGDSLLAFSAYDELLKCKMFIDNPHLPNLEAICRELGGNITPHTPEYTRLYNHGLSVLEPGYAYFKQKIMGDESDGQNPADLAGMVHLFKTARYLHPCRAVELGFSLALIDEFLTVKAVKKGTISIQNLRNELPQYLAACQGVSLDIDLKEFWRNRAGILPTFVSLFVHFCLLQPSSGACERVFSIVKNLFDPQQSHALHDYVETAVMVNYNSRNE